MTKKSVTVKLLIALVLCLICSGCTGGVAVAVVGVGPGAIAVVGAVAFAAGYGVYKLFGG